MDDLNYGDLEKFIEKALEESQSTGSSRKALNEDQLRDVALRYGVSVEKWQEICQEADDHRTRGNHFLKAENWDDAIAELEKALVVLPYDSALRYQLASAYAGQYRKDGSPADRNRAEELYRQCLAHDPDHVEAVRSLTELEGEAEKAGKTKAPILMTVVSFGLIALIWSIVSRNPTEDEPTFTGGTSAEKSEGVESSEVNPEEGTIKEMLPVEFPVADLEDAFDFEIRSSILTRYPGKFGFELKAAVLPKSVEVGKMIGELQLIGKDEAVVATGRFEAHAGYHSPALPGDSLPARVLIFEESAAPVISAARIILTEAETLPFEGAAEPGRLREEVSELPLPPDISVEIRERNVVRSRAGFGDQGKAQIRPVLTVENTGRGAIRKLSLRIEVYDTEGELLPLGNSSITDGFVKKGLVENAPDKISVVSSMHPPLVHGERRVADARIYVPDADAEDIGEYLIVSIEVE